MLGLPLSWQKNPLVRPYRHFAALLNSMAQFRKLLDIFCLLNSSVLSQSFTYHCYTTRIGLNKYYFFSFES